MTAARTRTQAQRSAATREKVIQAVVACIAEDGYAKATAARIARRAGVTGGAIVHQFGNKDAVLLAVLERSFANLSNSVAQGLAGGAATPRQRVALLVHEIWARLNAPAFRAFLEIVLNRRRRAGNVALKAGQEHMIHALSGSIWAELFAPFGTDATTLDLARTLTSSTLLGMAILAMVGARKPDFSRELAALERNVLHLLGLEDSRVQPASSPPSRRGQRKSAPQAGRPGYPRKQLLHRSG